MELLGKLTHDLSGQRHMYNGASRRTYQPVRKHSFQAGRCEGVFWRSTDRKQVNKIVLAAKRYEIGTKQKGKRNGALGHVALEILEYLANLIDYRTGRLDPSIETLKTKLNRSRDAIVRALKALRTHGFIDWLRRYVPTGNKGAGVQVQQTSNAYRLSLPKRALRFMGRYGQQAPVSDDLKQAEDDHAAMVQDMLSTLSKQEQIAAEFGTDDALGQALIRLRNAMDKRESAEQTESQSKDSFNRKKDRLAPDIE